MSQQSHLELTDLNIAFGGASVIRDLSLAVSRGESVVIFGPSGSGKTTLLKLIAGNMVPDSGSIAINGQDATRLEPEHRGVAMAFQTFALYPHMSAFDNIASPLKQKGFDRNEIDRRVRATASMLKIEHVLSHNPGALSNGQKQRTALARALVPEADIVLLDDPLRNVDAKLRYEMRLELPRVIAEFNATLLYVTQDFKEAMALGDRVAVLLDDGTLHQIDTPSAVYDAPADADVAELFGDPPINLLDVRPTRGGDGHVNVCIGDTELPAPSCPDSLVESDCRVGIRPEDVQIVDEQADNTVAFLLETTLPLNVRTATRLVHDNGLAVTGSEWALDESTASKKNTKVWARVDLSNAVYFPAAS
ncbi:ABC transporter ATP-binding protein [Salinisphaera orenii]|uniref:ABC transporter ATP-binding protein n=1 Tax=Salinisphaera orenii TaxID=856731 RepID=UPI000DBE083E